MDFDEVFSLRLIDAPLIRIVIGQQYDQGTPPLQFVLLKLWQNVVGSFEPGLRLLPLVSSILAAWWFWLLIVPHLDQRLAGVVVALAWFNSTVWFYSSYLKPYALLLCFCYLTLWLCQRLFTARHTTVQHELSLAGIIAAGFYTHYSFVLFSAVLFVSATIVYRHATVYKHYLRAFGIAGMLYLPWILYFAWHQFSPSTAGTKYFFHQLLEGWIGFDGWLSVMTNGLSEYVPPRLQSPVAILAFILIGLIILRAFRKERNAWRKTLYLCTLVTFVVLFLTPLHTVFTEARYTIYGIPLLIFCLISATKTRWQTAPALLLTGILCLTVVTRTWYADTVRTDWKQLVLHVSAEQPAVILADPCHLSYIFTYYYQGRHPVFCLIKNPEGMPQPLWDQQPSKTIYILKYTSGFGYEGHLIPWLHIAPSQEKSFGIVSLQTTSP